MLTLSDISHYRKALMGAAIIIVILYHCSQASCFAALSGRLALYSYYFVDVFFLLSGFGLYHSLRRNPAVASFYKRRLLRLVPSYWLVIGAYHLLAVAVLGIRPDFAQYIDHPHSLWQGLCYYSTLGWWLHPMQLQVYYYDWFTPTIVLFYALFPLMAKFGSSTRRAAVLVMVCYAIALACTWLYMRYDNQSLLFLSFTRLHIFAMGILLYHLVGSHDSRRGVAATLVCIAAIVLTTTGTIDVTTSRSSAIVVKTIASTFLVVGLCVLSAVPMHIMVVRKCFEFIGNHTFQLYIVHVPVIAIVRKLLGWDDWQVLVAIGIALLLAILTKKVADMITTHISPKVNNAGRALP